MAVVLLMQDSWAWSPTEGVTRQPISGLVSHVIAAGIPQRAGPITKTLSGSCKPVIDAGRDEDARPADPPGTFHGHTQALCDQAERGVAHVGEGENLTSPRHPGNHRPKPETSELAPALQTRHAGVGTTEDAALLYCGESDSIGSVASRFLLLVPITDMHTCTPAGRRPGAEVIAVLKLMNKTGTQDGMFSFVDEGLVQAMAGHAAAALQMAQYVPKVVLVVAIMHSMSPYKKNVSCRTD